MRSPSQLVKLLAFVCPPYSFTLSRNEPMAVAFSCFSVLRSRSESKREHEQMGLTVISAFLVAISPLLRCDSSIDSAVWFALSSSSIKLPSDIATLSGTVMAWRPGNVVSATGREPPERARPVAEDVTEPLKMRVYGRSVTK